MGATALCLVPSRHAPPAPSSPSAALSLPPSADEEPGAPRGGSGSSESRGLTDLGPNPNVSDSGGKPCAPSPPWGHPTDLLHSPLSPGPRELPCVHTQCLGPAPEPGHDPHHPQAVLRGHAAGEQPRRRGCVPGALSSGHRAMPSRGVAPCGPLLHPQPVPFVSPEHCCLSALASDPGSALGPGERAMSEC